MTSLRCFAIGGGGPGRLDLPLGASLLHETSSSRGASCKFSQKTVLQELVPAGPAPGLSLNSGSHRGPSCSPNEGHSSRGSPRATPLWPGPHRACAVPSVSGQLEPQ